MRNFEKTKSNSQRKLDRNIYAGERSRKRNKPQRGHQL